MIRSLQDPIQAAQFLTRLPIPGKNLDPARLNRAAAWFPAVGLLVGLPAAGAFLFLTRHLDRMPAAALVVLLMILITGGLHEDGVADCADAFGGGWTKEDRLRILKDSRIGSFGGIALVISFSMRVLLIASIPSDNAFQYLLAAQILSRWTPLPLGKFLSPARGKEGQGGRIANAMPWITLLLGTAIAAVSSIYLLHQQTILTCTVVLVVTALCAYYFQRRLGGITGDCMGATIQLTECFVYLCGAWIR